MESGVQIIFIGSEHSVLV